MVHVNDNDATSVEALSADEHEAIVLSPGPCTPNEAGICLDLVRKGAGKMPIFGVCLGLQSDRPGLRRQGRARAAADARQGLERSSTRRAACFAASTGRFRRRAITR